MIAALMKIKAQNSAYRPALIMHGAFFKDLAGNFSTPGF
jgi:hypothetical protein